MTSNTSPSSASYQHDERTPGSVYIIAAIAAMGGLLFGYDTGVISGAQLFLNETFSLGTFEQSLAVSIALVGAIIGALTVGRMNDKLGRKTTLIVLAVIFSIGAILTAIAGTFFLFLLFRLIVGFGFGAVASAVPVYISEVAPPDKRGGLVTLNQLAITIGIAISYWVDLAFANAGMGWPPMFGVAAIPAVIFLVGMFFNPETPRWLALQGRWDDARKVLERLRGKEAGDRELDDMRMTLAQEHQGSYRELLQPGLRMALLVGVGLAVFQQFVGINTIIYYAPVIFQSAGVPSASSAILATSVVGVLNVLATIVAITLVDRLGRRVLLLVGTAGMIVSLIAMGLIFAVGSTSAGILVLIALLVYVAAFAIGFGPVFWLMSAEVFPTRARAAGSSISTFSNWFANLLVSLTFLPLIVAIGETSTFWLYAAFAVAAFVFCYRLVPETKGRSLEDIDYYWEHHRHWKPTISNADPGL